MEEGFEGGADELDVGVCAGGEAEEEDAGDQGGDDHCALAADVFDVDGVAGQDGAGDADDGGDGVVAVHGVGGLLGAAAGLFEVLGEEGVEEGVAHANGGPAEPEEDGCGGCFMLVVCVVGVVGSETYC